MQIITLASRKGGAGKTTVARNLAVAAELAGEGPVALVDIDPQGGLAAWWNRREAETPAFINCDTSNLSAEILRLRSAGFAYCIIDTPPSVEDTARLAIRLATLAVVPVQPSPRRSERDRRHDRHRRGRGPPPGVRGQSRHQAGKIDRRGGRGPVPARHCCPGYAAPERGVSIGRDQRPGGAGIRAGRHISRRGPTALDLHPWKSKQAS
ncbi:ParA family protein [Dankookia rubra]|uniref:ParA family protein n=1 Tax=Dankookia rubra TaxID=1442381 RepID=A0A4R5QAM7_9PROT|nr:ParA family protein [Dankookia rubra]